MLLLHFLLLCTFQHLVVAMNAPGSPAVNIDFNDTPGLVKRILEIQQPRKQKAFLSRVLSTAASSPDKVDLIHAFFKILHDQVAFAFQVPLAEAFKVAAEGGNAVVCKAILEHDLSTFNGQLLLQDDHINALIDAGNPTNLPVIDAILDTLPPETSLQLIEAMKPREAEIERMAAIYLQNKEVMLQLGIARCQLK